MTRLTFSVPPVGSLGNTITTNAGVLNLFLGLFHSMGESNFHSYIGRERPIPLLIIALYNLHPHYPLSQRSCPTARIIIFFAIGLQSSLMFFFF